LNTKLFCHYFLNISSTHLSFLHLLNQIHNNVENKISLPQNKTKNFQMLVNKLTQPKEQ
jgi:hypothetical protein